MALVQLAIKVALNMCRETNCRWYIRLSYFVILKSFQFCQFYGISRLVKFFVMAAMETMSALAVSAKQPLVIYLYLFDNFQLFLSNFNIM
jgi:hypothetical protein